MISRQCLLFATIVVRICGILIFAIAFEMVLGTRSLREARQAERAMTEHVRDVAAFPLAIPLIAGRGAITATLLLAGRA